jgi:oligopeptide transport system substrate-binding protein
MFKRVLALALCIATLVSCTAILSSCDWLKNLFGPGYEVETFTGDYTYKDSVSTLSNNWNPHTYQTSDESYPISFITTGLYGFFFNDELIHKSTAGKAAYEGYVIVPEMAASLPVDVTEQVKATGKYNIPESATKGYAYTIDLNPNATWANGEKINADTYVYSMEMLLHPDYQNYRATDYFSGSLAVANADKFYYQGTTQYQTAPEDLALSGLTKDDNGNYLSVDGNPLYVAVYMPIAYFDYDALGDYVDYYGSAYFDTTDWEALVAATDEETGLAPLNDTTYGYLKTTITGNPAWGEDESFLYNYIVEQIVYEDNYDFNGVGLYKSGEYQITLVLDKSLSGFNLLYSLSSNWIVYQPYYDECMKKQEGTDAYTTTYNTTPETTMSYGPYVMTGYELDKSMTFEKNDNWFGYTDGKHIYKDPTDGKVYPMYQTTKIDCQVVKEASTRKLMFLSGKLMGYGLQADDYAQFRDSEYCYVTPSETIFFFIFNGHMDAIKEREAAEDFDQSKKDLETMTLNSFRRAMAVTFDKEALCTAISPSRSGGFGLIGSNYIYDPETGAKYRDTDQAKKALCDFYSVDVNDFGGDLDAAVDSITGYDVDKARELYTLAFEEALEKGFVTDTNNDGKSDQVVEIVYASSSPSDFITKTLDYLNEKLAEVLVGTPFEGSIKFVESAPLGNEWSDKLKAGMADTVLGGWPGSALDPFGLTDLYTNPAYQYDAQWFNAATVALTLTIDGEEITMNLKQWSDALNGDTVTVDGKDYCFGADIADVETRLDILAAIEAEVLKTYNYIPMLQDGGMSLLSKQVYYVVEEYNPIMGRGGITYLKYNYNDQDWDAYVKEQGGQLTY